MRSVGENGNIPVPSAKKRHDHMLYSEIFLPRVVTVTLGEYLNRKLINH